MRGFARRLTATKVTNGLKVLSSYYLSRITGKARMWGMPVSMALEPTTACNLGCPECPSGLKQFSRPTGNLQWEVFQKILDETAPYLTNLTFYFQGEPFINPKFLELVKTASNRNIFTTTSTNAHFLHDKLARQTVESGLDRLIVSIDGTTQEVYEQYRKRGSLDKVLEGTKNVIEWKKKLKSRTPEVVFQFLVVKPNEHQIEEVKKLGEEMGVDQVKFKTAQVYDYKNGNPLIPENEKYSRYKKQEEGTYEIKNTLDNHCWRMWHSCVVTWDGKIVPCCFDKDAEHRLGTVEKNDFKQVWEGQGYQHFRKQIMRSRGEVDICQNCTEGTKVWA